jgi:hypothetical protein
MKMSITKVAGAFCVSLAMTAALSAQTASQNPTQQPPATAATAQGHSVTVEGCLVREKDVPGRQANPAERAGVMEDFVLTNAKIVKGGHTPPDAAATGTTGSTATGEQPAGTSGGTGKMFEVRGLNETELQQFIGQRVEIEGQVDPADIAERSREQASPAGEPAGDLPELKGMVIRKATSAAPCTPAK